MTEFESYKVLWAKSEPQHPLWKHLLDVAAVSLALKIAPPQGWSANQIALIIGLHDIGKADAAFQHQVADFSVGLRTAGYPVTVDARCRHERLSARFVKNKLTKTGTQDFAASAIARAVLAHHGYWNESARDVAPEYAKAQNDLCQLLEQVLGVTELPIKVLSNLSDFGMRLAGLIVLSDWIASNDEFFTDKGLQGIEHPQQYFLKAMEVAGDRVAKLGLERDASPGQPNSVVGSARPIQKALLEQEIPPGLVIIEAPMGEGKTEAAWILAEKWREKGYHGMYVALPTMATSDSLHRRYRDDYLKKLGRAEDTKLVHGMAWLRDEKETEKAPNIGEPGDDRSLAAAWFRPTRRAMLAAHGVGTVDQAMLAGMHVKFGFLRLFGLADRVLVIDEVHAYDAYMTAIIARLLQWCACLKIPVILLSATLSAKQRAAMLKAYGASGEDPGPEALYPLITIGEPGKEAWSIPAVASLSRKLTIRTHPGLFGDAKKTAVKAVELVKDGGCCCVVLNTVKQAQTVYDELKLSEERKLLFHARFTADDRQKITERVLEMFGKNSASRPPKFVLVATQVVEQSLDVDFDHMISDIAPIDLLLQRSGRIKRHSRNWTGEMIRGADQRGDPVLHVLTPKLEGGKLPKFGASEFIYQPYPLLRTIDVLVRLKLMAEILVSLASVEVAQSVKAKLQALKDKEFGSREEFLAALSNQLTNEELEHFQDHVLNHPDVLSANSVVNLPDKFRPLIEAVYGDDLPPVASEAMRKAKQNWDDLQEDLTAQAGEFLLCEPMADEFDPVGADEVGDDSDDGNGWRARTRLGLEDVLVIPLSTEDVEKFKKGDLHPKVVKWLYQRSVKIPPYYWPPKAAKEYGQPVLGEKKLRGVWLLPVKGSNGAWSWSGIKEDGKSYEINYDSTIGLTHGGDK
jgi:CRISPR-associated endonuclease/helicase Cas3